MIRVRAGLMAPGSVRGKGPVGVPGGELYLWPYALWWGSGQRTCQWGLKGAQPPER